MIRKILVILVALLMLGCSDRDGSIDGQSASDIKWYKSLVNSNENAKALGIVFNDADQIAKNESGEVEYWKFLYSYLESIKRRIENCTVGITIDDGNNSFQRGSDAADEFFDDNKHLFKNITLEDYGYTAVMITGRYFRDFEKSELVESATGNKYWADFATDQERATLGNGEMLEVAGYRDSSEDQGYGHFNKWRYRIIIKSFKLVK